eukprot:1906319-Pyramimonas_sp.AAC.2
MRAEVQPDVVSYTALISALLANKEVERALSTLRIMDDHGCKRDRVLYDTTLKGLARTPHWRDAMRVGHRVLLSLGPGVTHVSHSRQAG